MNIIEKPVSELIPYENNPRLNDAAVEYVANSIKSFGWKQPIVIDKDGVIIAGHSRHKAALKLGLKTAPCVVADDLTPDQVKAYRLADNKVAEFAEWDFDQLQKELDELDFDMSEFGFDDLYGGVQETETETATEDNYEINAPVEPKAKPGDIYQLGRHRLMCGNCTDPDAVAKLMNGEKAALQLTDPPYGINVVRGGTSEQATGRVGVGGARCTSGKVGGGRMKTPHNNRISPEAVVPAKTYSAIIGDETTETAKKNYEIAKEHSENQIIFGGNYFTDFLPPSRCWVVWDKDNTGNFADAELAWTSFDRGVKLYKWTWNGLVRQGDRATEGITRLHPTQKPVGMLSKIINDFTDDGDAVLDCFGGSGSTLIACEQTGRRCFMMEIDPHYVDVIIQRWENLTGEKAVLLKG